MRITHTNFKNYLSQRMSDVNYEMYERSVGFVEHHYHNDGAVCWAIHSLDSKFQSLLGNMWEILE